MEPTKLFSGKIVRSEDPLNLEAPFENLDGFITPTSAFYVRTHFPIPKISKAGWRVRIEGELDRPFELSYDDLLKFKPQTIPVTLECAGNNRDLLATKVKGVQWGLGAVGNAAWTGVPLAEILSRAGIKPSAREVVLEGADEGPLEDPKAPRGHVRFARSIPLSKANENVLLAYKINDVELPPEHGFPVRAIVPGWFAVASVKWLQRIIVTDRPFNGYYQTLDYAFWKRGDGNAELVPLTELQVKAEIARPIHGESVPADSTVRIYGAAWAGGAEIASVEVSTDAGKTWNGAKLEHSVPNAWRLWEYEWKTPPKSGQCTLIARAIDSLGRSQPAERDLDRGTYMINHLLPVTVQITSGQVME
jgi:DMSO/TMAO reductase YedYZ molybdopterin-dependent catalytic subunit